MVIDRVRTLGQQFQASSSSTPRMKTESERGGSSSTLNSWKLGEDTREACINRVWKEAYMHMARGGARANSRGVLALWMLKLFIIGV